MKNNMTNSKKNRRIASNEIVLEDGSCLTLSVVEIQSGIVSSVYPLTQELPHTEWLPGTLCLKRDSEGMLRAYYNDLIIN